MFKLNEKGQSLIELAIAMGVAIMIIGALVSLGVTSLKGAGAARNKAQAAKLANQGMEMARRARDDAATWGEFLGYSVDESVDDFTRTIVVQEVESGKKAQVTTTVSWTDSAGTHPVILVSYLTNWRR